MAINKGELFNKKDVYIDYPFEDVMYRWDHVEEKIYVKFYGKDESENTVTFDNRLFNEALLSGNEISRDEYLSKKGDAAI